MDMVGFNLSTTLSINDSGGDVIESSTLVNSTVSVLLLSLSQV